MAFETQRTLVKFCCAGLAALLLSRYDVFLLDEPTNDLDFRGLELLEQVVSGWQAACEATFESIS